LKSLSGIMENVAAYRLWQAPFAEKKLAPLLRRPDLAGARRVLDVGCGPGTNTRHFAGAEYVGIDMNPAYIAYARRRFGREFVVADVRTYVAPAGQRFDFILVNSLLHHIDDSSTRQILASLASLLTADGHVHILDLILPDRRSLARLLALWDRGHYPRKLETLEAIFREHFDPVAMEPYPLGALGITLWDMVYFKGRRRA
jgi:SAM-dependent methyltransferase